MGLVLIMLGVWGALAMTHLGQPLRAFNVVFGLAHFSPLSLEIATTGAFGGAVFVYGAMAHFGILEKLHKLVLARAALLFMGLGCWIISATRGNNSGVVLAAFSTVLVLVAELCGRIFFYDMLALAL